MSNRKATGTGELGPECLGLAEVLPGGGRSLPAFCLRTLIGASHVDVVLFLGLKLLRCLRSTRPSSKPTLQWQGPPAPQNFNVRGLFESSLARKVGVHFATPKSPPEPVAFSKAPSRAKWALI